MKPQADSEPCRRLSAAVLMFRTAQNGPRQAGRGPKRPKVAEKHPNRVRPAPWSRPNGPTALLDAQGCQGHRKRAFGAGVTPRVSVFLPVRARSWSVHRFGLWPGARAGLQANPGAGLDHARNPKTARERGRWASTGVAWPIWDVKSRVSGWPSGRRYTLQRHLTQARSALWAHPNGFRHTATRPGAPGAPNAVLRGPRDPRQAFARLGSQVVSGTTSGLAGQSRHGGWGVKKQRKQMKKKNCRRSNEPRFVGNGVISGQIVAFCFGDLAVFRPPGPRPGPGRGVKKMTQKKIKVRVRGSGGLGIEQG